jgi:hypothetical protein
MSCDLTNKKPLVSFFCIFHFVKKSSFNPLKFLKMKKSRFYQKCHALRERILTGIVAWLNPIYLKWMPRNRHWRHHLSDLRHYPEGSLGRDFAQFMDKNQFGLLPYLETHDVYHVILGYQPTLVDEARMYFFLLGNGRWTLETLSTVWVSLWVLPDYWRDLWAHYRRGKAAQACSDWDFRFLMREKTAILRGIIFEHHKPYFFM